MHVVCAVQSLLSISYIVLALPSTVTKLSNKTSIFHDLQGPTIKFHDFPGLENEMLKFHDFPGFPWHVQTLPHGTWGGSKAKVPSVGKIHCQFHSSTTSLWRSILSLAITRGLKSVTLPSLKTADRWGSVSSSDNTNKDLVVLISQSHPGITIIMAKVNIANKVLRLKSREFAVIVSKPHVLLKLHSLSETTYYWAIHIPYNFSFRYFSSETHNLQRVFCPGGGGEVLYIGYMGMCSTKGYVFLSHYGLK